MADLVPERVRREALAHLGPVDTYTLVEQLSAAGPDGPAPLLWRPCGVGSAAEIVEAIVAELERAVVGLFPAWLPEAADLRGLGGSNEAAARSVARRVGVTSSHHGPYAAAMAVASLGGRERADSLFAAELRAREAASLFAASYGRASTVVVVELPDLDVERRDALLDAATFLIRHGRLQLWLAGSNEQPLPGVAVEPCDWMALTPKSVAEPVPRVWFPPAEGRPHPASKAEVALERALADEPWAGGRSWNATYAPMALRAPMRLDLAWFDEGLAVEIDGPEHRAPARYEADRRRDVLLALDGFVVVRFTNEQLAGDLALVVDQLRQLVAARRRAAPEGNKDA